MVRIYGIVENGELSVMGSTERPEGHKPVEDVHRGNGPVIVHESFKELPDKFIRVFEYGNPYDRRRRKEYPSVGDQLDMIWHAMDRGEAEKIEPFYSSIKSVKDAHPKGT